MRRDPLLRAQGHLCTQGYGWERAGCQVPEHPCLIPREGVGSGLAFKLSPPVFAWHPTLTVALPPLVCTGLALLQALVSLIGVSPMLPSHLIHVSSSRKPSRLSWVAPLPKPPGGPSGPAMTSAPCSPLCRNTAPPVDQELREGRGLSHLLCVLPQPWPELNQGPTALHIPAPTLPLAPGHDAPAHPVPGGPGGPPCG